MQHTGEVKAQKVVKSGQITDPDRLFNDISVPICKKYTEIGIELGLELEYLTNELETGKSEMQHGNLKALKMLKLWQQSTEEDNFTYAVLAAALEKHGFRSLAEKYCYTSSICRGNRMKFIMHVLKGNYSLII